MRARALACLVAPLAAAAACGDVSMNQQPKYSTEAPAPLLPGATESQSPPEGAVAQDRAAYDLAEAQPPRVTAAVVARGRERHDIACRPCHGPSGAGDGTIVARGFPRPAAYGDPEVRAMSGRQLYEVIARGYGRMAPQAERVAPTDRWAIVAYIRALQIATNPGETRSPAAAAT